MNTAYFVKVSSILSWSNLKDTINTLESSHIQPLPYKIAAELCISSTEFEKLLHSMPNPNILYTPFASLSIATSNGIWNCILIKCIDDYRNILIYTAGNMYPLYISIVKH